MRLWRLSSERGARDSDGGHGQTIDRSSSPASSTLALVRRGGLSDDSAGSNRFATHPHGPLIKKRKSNGCAPKVLDKPPLHGWKTTDEDELNLRRWRGRTEVARIEALEPEYGAFGTFRARSS